MGMQMRTIVGRSSLFLCGVLNGLWMGCRAGFSSSVPARPFGMILPRRVGGWGVISLVPVSRARTICMVYLLWVPCSQSEHESLLRCRNTCQDAPPPLWLWCNAFSPGKWLLPACGSFGQMNSPSFWGPQDRPQGQLSRRRYLLLQYIVLDTGACDATLAPALHPTCFLLHYCWVYRNPSIQMEHLTCFELVGAPLFCFAPSDPRDRFGSRMRDASFPSHCENQKQRLIQS